MEESLSEMGTDYDDVETENLLDRDQSESGSWRGYDRDAVDYEEALKETGFGKFHIIVILLCGWAVSSDAVEVLSVSFMLPSATRDLDMSSSQKGWLNSIIFVGMMIGGYFWGSLADQHGRRAILLGSLTVNGLGGLASSAAQVYWAFLLARFISGIGVGGSIPVIFAYFTEFQPKEKRGMMISVLATFWMCGNIIAAGLAWIVIPQSIGYHSPSFTYNSWRIFVALCTIPSLSSAAIFVLMPESPKFLLTIGKELAALNVLKKVYDANNPKSSVPYSVKSVILSADYKVKPQRHHKDGNNKSCCASMSTNVKVLLSTSKELFRYPLLRKTVIMAIVYFTLSFGYYGLWMWFPELFNRVEKYGGSPCDHANSNNNPNATVPPSQISTTGQSLYNLVATESNHNTPEKPDNWIYFSGFMTALSNLPGNIISILFMDRFGRKTLLATSMVISGISVFLIPMIHSKVENLLISCLFGAVSTIGWNSLDVLSAELFPTNVRSTAFGILTGISRLAAIAGNVVFGELVDVLCYIPMIMVSVLLVFGGLSSILLPNTTNIDIH